MLYVSSIFIDDCIVTDEWPLRVFRLKDRALVLANKFPNLHLNIIVVGRSADLNIEEAQEKSITKEICDLK